MMKQSVGLVRVLCFLLAVAVAALPGSLMGEEGEGLPDRWSGSLSLGASLTGGNRSSYAATADSSLKREWKEDSLEFTGYANWGRSEGDDTADAQRLRGKYRHYLRRHCFLFGRQEIGRDGIQSVKLRSITDGGPG